MPRGRKPREKAEYTGLPTAVKKPQSGEQGLTYDIREWCRIHQVPNGWFRELKSIIEKHTT